MKKLSFNEVFKWWIKKGIPNEFDEKRFVDLKELEFELNRILIEVEKYNCGSHLRLVKQIKGLLKE